MKYWHDLEKTIEANRGMSVAVVEGVAISNGQPLDAVQPDPKLRPTVDIFGYLNYAPPRPDWVVVREVTTSKAKIDNKANPRKE